MALLDTPMTAIHCARGLLTVAHGRERKDSLDIGAELRLVLFDHHDIIAALFDKSLRDVALGQERVHRDKTTCKGHLL